MIVRFNGGLKALFAIVALVYSSSIAIAQDGERLIVVDLAPAILHRQTRDGFNAEMMRIHRKFDVHEGKPVHLQVLDTSAQHGLTISAEQSDNFLVFRNFVMGLIVGYPGKIARLDIADAPDIDAPRLRALFSLDGLTVVNLQELDKISNDSIVSAAKYSDVKTIIISRCPNVDGESLKQLLNAIDIKTFTLKK